MANSGLPSPLTVLLGAGVLPVCVPYVWVRVWGGGGECAPVWWGVFMCMC